MFNFILKFFSKEKASPDMKKFLIAGLGNIGEEYAQTRHNIGFKVLDYFAEKEAFTFESSRLAERAEYKLKGRTFVLIKPMTYMNLSGKAVRYWLEKENIPIENLLVITDDLNLPFGSIRVRLKGSDGGHNGLKDIQEQLQTTHYNRYRFGISNEYEKGRQIDYVLGKWSEEELKKLPERLEKSVELVKSFGLSGIQLTMNLFNGK
jgi:PTH1 family peptidyl-tRNA hydrolase